MQKNKLPLKVFLILFLVFYFFILLQKIPKGTVFDEGAHSMDSFFFYTFFQDFLKQPKTIFYLKNYVYRFYTFYPALYLIYYPPLYDIITSGFFTIFGVNSISARITTIFFSILTLVVLYFMAKEFYKKEEIALFSSLILAFAPYYFIFSFLAMVDIPLIFFILLSILLFYRGVERDKKYFKWFGVVFGLGYLMRYLIVVILPSLLLYLLYRKKLKENLKNLVIASTIFLGIIAPYLIVQIFFKGFEVISYWIVGTQGSVIGCSFFECPLSHLFFYPSLLYVQIFPLAFLFPLGYFLVKREYTKENFLLISLIFSYFLIFTFLPLKTHKYLIPTLPFFSLLFVSTLYEYKRIFYPIVTFSLVFSFIFSYFFPPYNYANLIDENKLNFDMNKFATKVNSIVVKNGNIFLLPGIDHSGFIFHFASINKFNNHVLRWRECIFDNMNKEGFIDFVNQNNIYLILAQTTSENSKYLEWAEKIGFYPVETFEDVMIYQNPKKDFQQVKEICDYNCKIKEFICYKFY